jgi:hypothetical protein
MMETCQLEHSDLVEDIEVELLDKHHTKVLTNTLPLTTAREFQQHCLKVQRFLQYNSLTIRYCGHTSLIIQRKTLSEPHCRIGPLHFLEHCPLLS